MDSGTSRAQPGWLARKVPELFGIDRRSLALFRIGLGVMFLLDLSGRARSLREHYTGQGVFPREAALELRPGAAQAVLGRAALDHPVAATGDSRLFHLFLWSDRVEVQGLLFAAFAAVALSLLVGYRTRLASALSFLFLVSLVRRNPYVCHTGDTWLEALSFWALFLPLGSRFSLDRLMSRGRAPGSPRSFSLATAAALLQVLVFYVSAGYLKSRYDVWLRGDAVSVFTHAVEYTRPFGDWLGGFPAACRFLTYSTLVLEGLAPFLFFCPFFTPAIRGLLIAIYAGFHLTLQLAIHIGIFQLTCLVGLALFVPGEAWEGLARRVPVTLKRRWSVLSAAFESRFARAERPEPPAARPLRRWSARLGQALAAFALAIVLVSNVNTARKNPYSRGDRGPLPLPRPVEDYGRQLGLVQNWNMFTDIDRLFFGWFLVLGQQDDGKVVDILERAPFSGVRRPEHFATFFPNHNARRFWRETTLPGNEFLLRLLAVHLVREWQRAGNVPLAHLALFQVGRTGTARASDDEVKNLCAWERPRPDLKDAAPAERERWFALREEWRKFLAGLPRTVPSSP